MPISFILAIVALIKPMELQAQLSDSKIRTAYTYRFAQNIEWPEEQIVDSFRIAVYSNNLLLIQEFKDISRTRNLKNKPISIKIIKEIAQLTNPLPNIIYVEKQFNEELLKLFRKIEYSPVLVVTEDYGLKELIMINLYYTNNQPIRLTFEVNRSSIEEQHNLRILPKLLLLGGSKIDVAELYKKQEELLENASEKVRKFKLEIESLQDLINSQINEIKIQKNELKKQQTQIDLQKKSLDTLRNETENQKLMIADNLIILKKHQKEIEQQQEQKILETEEMLKRNMVLEKQSEEIQEQQQRIDSQGDTLNLQQKRIQTQKWFLLLSFSVVFLTLFLIFLIYRGYKSKQNANRLLEEKNIAIQHKNNEIERQKEELESFNEELSVTNDELIFQREEILDQNEEILAQKDKLQVANATKDKFFGIIAHDLRNPFNHLLGLSEILVEQIKAQNYSKSNMVAEAINQTSSETHILLENLLSWSRSQTGKIEFIPNSLNIKDVINTNIFLLKGSAESKGILLSSSLAENYIVYADKNMLLTILRNLITNAIKFSRKDDRIDIDAEEHDDFITIHVSDTGIGIDDKTIGKLFKVDEDIKKEGTAQEQGTGLGLILCKEFIDWHKGKIWAESKIGKGSRFSFTLPKG